MVDRPARLTRALSALTALSIAAGPFTVSTAASGAGAACRDGRAQGPYQLRDADGHLLVAGAFNDGRRTGSFIFWDANGVRTAHIPFDDDVRNGTAATWYEGTPGKEPPRRFEATWHRGVRDGMSRSWYADGRVRSESEYAGGRLVSVRAWAPTGERLFDEAARESERSDARAADDRYDELDTLVRAHVPRCE